MSRPATLRDSFPAERVANVLHRRTTLDRTQEFSDAASFKMVLSSSDFVGSFCRRRFSFYSSFSRFVWSVRSPPYFLRQR